MLDFTGSSKTLGKPALNDLKSGLATAPVLYAAESHAELRPLILRKFEEPGDVKLAQELVFGSDGIERTRQLAVSHARKAAEMVRPHSCLQVARLCHTWLQHWLVTDSVFNFAVLCLTALEGCRRFKAAGMGASEIGVVTEQGFCGLRQLGTDDELWLAGNIACASVQGMVWNH